MSVIKLLIEAAKIALGAIVITLTFGVVVLGIPTLIIVGSMMWLGDWGFVVGLLGVLFYIALLVLLMDKPMKAVGLAMVKAEVGSG